MMDFRKIFDIYEEQIPNIEEVTKAEEAIQKIYNKIATYNKELADNMDMVVGTFARAYEMQGFNGGLMSAKGEL